jgi:hypothetical protein
MNAYSVLADLLRPRPNKGQAAALLLGSEQVIRLPPVLDADDMPPEFENVLECRYWDTVND